MASFLGLSAPYAQSMECVWGAAGFLRRQQVLLLYRRILKAIQQVPIDSDRKYLKDWAREEFKRNKNATEEDTIRMMITQGNMQLKELEKTLALAKA
ncbi:LYR motif-containing protein 2 isoform X1 [Artibeus jamaicensis]|uniref:LYR motif-containing protein 2 isoform X1 n=1 Tax=Artibeus jamaicensis TaxID=9417 RepID=UPI00235A5699|nr:LYR motif-containing protein 2 isoform X1 [Artibeus jamaicensis]